MLARCARRLRRAAYTATPRHALWTSMRKAFGRTGFVYRLKRRHRAASRVARPLRRRASVEQTGTRPPKTKSVVLVSPCDFTGNTAVHVYEIARELARRGWRPIVAVPHNARGVRDLGTPSFPVLSYRAVRRRLLGRNDDAPALVHSFTPRENVRALTADLVAAHGCSYVVHLEDNENVIALAETGRDAADGPVRREFMERSAGVTAVVERLLELKPDRLPGVVAWPGHDESPLDRGPTRERVRGALGLATQDLLVAYTGNVHEANVQDVANLYRGIARARSSGHRLTLVKTGWSSVPRSALPDLGVSILDVGWVARKRVREIMSAADILVQPGRPDPFNDYRFPSKLPDFLASGNPVLMPRSNIGLELTSGRQALLLERGDADEIAGQVAVLASDPALREQIGLSGRAFAVSHLRWTNAVDRIESVYRVVANVEQE